jgi:class 3 adenylate cyclase
MAGPGDICVSGSVYDQVKRKLDLGFDELGPQTIKNIAEPVAVYRVGSQSSAAHEYHSTGGEGAAACPPSLRLPCFRSSI